MRANPEPVWDKESASRVSESFKSASVKRKPSYAGLNHPTSRPSFAGLQGMTLAALCLAHPFTAWQPLLVRTASHLIPPELDSALQGLQLVDFVPILCLRSLTLLRIVFSCIPGAGSTSQGPPPPVAPLP